MRPRLAYLVLAHDQPEHLHRLIRRLASPAARFYVHVDRKSDLGPFRALATEPGVTLIDDRERVRWGGFSIVRATLKLLGAAIADEPGFQRYVLLSGADFPIKDRRTIEGTLLDSSTEYVGLWRRLSGTPRAPQFAFVERFHLPDHPLFSHEPGLPLRRRLARWPCIRLLGGVNACLPRRAFPLGLVPYHGSQWWALTGECVRHVLDFTAAHPEYAAFFRTVSCSDEIFFQTLVRASPFAARISHDVAPRASQSGDLGCHLILWGPEARHPSPMVLDESHLPAILASPSLFARKFRADRSARLLAMLEERFRD